MEINVTIPIYEINGEETGIDHPVLELARSWNWSEDKVILIWNEEAITVYKKDLLKAITAVTI